MLYDIRRLQDAEGNWKQPHELSEEEAWCIESVETVIKNAAAGDGHTDRVLKYRFVKRAEYVGIAAKHLGMLVERLELKGDDALIQALLAGRKRAAESQKT